MSTEAPPPDPKPQNHPDSDTVQCIDVHGRTYATPRSTLQWRPSAYAIIIHNNSILLLRQFSNKYDLPGGGLNIGEDPKVAVLREVHEETNLIVSKPVCLGVESCLFRSTHSDDKVYHSLLMYYSCIYESHGHDQGISLKGLDVYEKTYVDGVEWVGLDRLSEIGVGSTVDWRPYVEKARVLRDVGNL